MFRAFLSTLILQSVLLSAPLARAQSALKGERDDLQAQLSAYFERWHELGRFHGSVLVAQHGKVLFEAGYGLANLEWRIPNSPDTRFGLASISKQFTCVLVLQLAAEGRLDLDDRLAEHLPGYRADTASRVTIDQLLRHTSGIPCFLNDDALRPARTAFPALQWRGDPMTFVEQYLSWDLAFEPGARYSYSNTGYDLLALVVEAVSGRSHAQNLRERILEPLGLEDTGCLTHSGVVERLASAYSKAPRGLVRAANFPAAHFEGSGSLYSTVRDLLRWNLALESEELLPAEWRDKMFTVHSTSGSGRHAYSIDHHALRDAEGRAIPFTGFSGGGFGFSTDVLRFPSAGLIVAILDNTGQYNHWRMAPDVYRILEGRFDSMPAGLFSDALARCAVEEGLAAALELFLRESEAPDESHERGVVERELNDLGYAALRSGDLEDALVVLRLNASLFPDSWNVHSSLAEACRWLGDDAGALRLQEKARVMKADQERLARLLRRSAFEEAREWIARVREREVERELLPSRVVGPLFEERLRSGDAVRALAICEVWAIANPTRPGPLFSMARVHDMRGDLDARRLCLQRARDLAPNSRAADAARKALSNY